MPAENQSNGLLRYPVLVSYGLLGLAFGISDLDGHVSICGLRPSRLARFPAPRRLEETERPLRLPAL